MLKPEMQSPEFKEQYVWEFTTTDGKVQYCLAPDVEEAAFLAQRLSEGKLKDVRLSDEQ